MSSVYSPRIITDSLFRYYDVANSRSYTSGSADWTDIVTNNVTMSLLGPQLSTTQPHSLDFNGSSDYGLFNTLTSTITGDRTYCAWAYSTGNVGSDHIINDVNNMGGGTLTCANGQFTARFGNGSGQREEGTSINITENEWQYLVATFDVATDEILMYINAQHVSSSTVSNISVSTGQLARRSNNTQFWNGSIGNIKLYTKKLTHQEIEQNFRAQKGRYI